MARTRKPLTEQEKHYIINNVGVMTDLQIAKALDRPKRTVAYYRKKLNVEAVKDTDTLKDPMNMTDNERSKFFREYLENSHFWEEIKLQLTSQEMNFYIHEWGQLSIQFKDILATEKRQIHDLIMTEIIDNRHLKKIKVLEDQYEIHLEKIEAFEKVNDIADDVAMAEYADEMRDLLALMSSQCKLINKHHEELVKQKTSLLVHLNGRRKDRITQVKEAKENIIGLIEAMNEKKVRDAQIRSAKAHKIAMEKEEKKWLENEVTFPDGKKDKILLTGKNNEE